MLKIFSMLLPQRSLKIGHPDIGFVFRLSSRSHPWLQDNQWDEYRHLIPIGEVAILGIANPSKSK